MIAHGKEIKVFCGNSNPDFARGICDELGLNLGRSEVKQFADGEVSVSVNETVRGCDVFVVQSTCNPVNIVQQFPDGEVAVRENVTVS